jgi:hypothetical protein
LISQRITRTKDRLNYFLFKWGLQFSKSKRNHKNYLQEIEHSNIEEDPVLKKYRDEVLEGYANKNAKSNLRILIHLAPLSMSPGFHTVAKSWIDTFNYLGIPCEALVFNEDVEKVLDSFKPNVFLSLVDPSFSQNIDYKEIAKYKQRHTLLVGLRIAINIREKGLIRKHIDWGKRNNVNFFYTHTSQKFINEFKYEKPFLDSHIKLISVEFGADILNYFPLNRTSNQLDYVFFGSMNYFKRTRYVSYFSKIIRKYDGIFAGPGWPGFSKQIPLGYQKSLYGIASAGLNLHIDEQIQYPIELNERTYLLAASGIPQIIDAPKILLEKYKENHLYISKNPEEYVRNLEYVLNNPLESKERAVHAFKYTLKHHSYFKRLQPLISYLNQIIEDDQN